MKILMIGGTRFIGRAIVKNALDQKHDVILFNRGKTDTSLALETIKGDVENIVNYKEEILKHNFDIVIHCIAYTEKHAGDIREVLKNTKVKLIILSSCDSYEAFQGLNRKQDKAELPIDEDSALSLMKYYWSDSTSKGRHTSKYDKNLLSDILMEGYYQKEFNITIFKLPMVYGPGDYQYPGRHGAFIQRILDREENLILSDREQCQVYTYGYITNIAAAITYSFDKDITNGKVYNIGDDKSRTRRKWAELYASQADWNFQYHVIPEELLRKDKSYRNAPPQHLLIDSSKYERETGFRNPVSVEVAVQETYNYAKLNPEVLGVKPNYDDERRLLNSYYSHLDQIYDDIDLLK